MRFNSSTQFTTTTNCVGGGSLSGSDDNKEVRDYLREHLETEYAVFEAQNGRKGLEAARTLYPDLIITDVMMPEMDGYKFIEEVRNDESIADIPIVMLTARADEREAATAIASGADDCVKKPFFEPRIRGKGQHQLEILKRTVHLRHMVR